MPARPQHSAKLATLGAITLMASAMLSPATVLGADPWLERVSLSQDGNELQPGPDIYTGSENLAISGDGRYVVFNHTSPELVPGDTNEQSDVFLRDLVTDTNELISVTTGGTPGNGSSGTSDASPITPDGRYVAFFSQDILAPGASGSGDVYLRDRLAGTTELVSKSAIGQTSDGTSGLTGLSITDDGRYLAYSSYATNLVAGDTNDAVDLFVFDRVTQTTVRASVSSSGAQGDGESSGGVQDTDIAIGSDGHVLVGFTSYASNLIDGDPGDGLFLHDVTTGTTIRLVDNSSGFVSLSDLSSDGALVVYHQITGDFLQVFLLDRTTDETELISANSAGQAAAPGEGGLGSFHGKLSGDARYVAFGSDADNLVGNDTNKFCDEGYGPTSCYEAFVRDRVAGTTARLSISDEGDQANFRTYAPAISRDGSTVAFVSYASNLVAGDTNEMGDVFVRPRGMQPSSASQVVAPGGSVSTGSSTNAAQPVAASVTSPQGGLISVSVEDTTGSPPPGYSFFGQHVSITAPPASPEQPLVLTFLLDGSLIPDGADPESVQVFRSEGLSGPDMVADCSATISSITPDPCVSDRTPSGGGVSITVLTSAASIWNFGLVESDEPPPPARVLFTSTRNGNAEIYSMNEDGSDVVRLTTSPRSDDEAAWSPDRSRIAFVSDRGGNSDIYLMDSDGNNLERLTSNPTSDVSPSWSPDGSSIAFSSGRKGNFDIYTVNVDGTGLTQRTTDKHDDVTPAWSPDGSKIAFASNRKGGDFEIYLMNTNGSGVTALTNSKKDDLAPSWSPDGSRIAFSSGRGGNDDIYTMTPTGSGVEQLTNYRKDDLTPSWSADGERIYFSSTRDGNMEIYSTTADGTDVQRLTNNPAVDSQPQG